MFTSLVVTDDAMRCLPSAWPRGGGAEIVSVLTRRLPVEIHGVTLEHLAESAGYLDDFTGPSLGNVIVPKMTEVQPAAAWSVGGIDNSPPLLAMPLAHCPY